MDESHRATGEVVRKDEQAAASTTLEHLGKATKAVEEIRDKGGYPTHVLKLVDQAHNDMEKAQGSLGEIWQLRKEKE